MALRLAGHATIVLIAGGRLACQCRSTSTVARTGTPSRSSRRWPTPRSSRARPAAPRRSRRSSSRWPSITRARGSTRPTMDVVDARLRRRTATLARAPGARRRRTRPPRRPRANPRRRPSPRRLGLRARLAGDSSGSTIELLERRCRHSRTRGRYAPRPVARSRRTSHPAAPTRHPGHRGGLRRRERRRPPREHRDRCDVVLGAEDHRLAADGGRVASEPAVESLALVRPEVGPPELKELAAPRSVASGATRSSPTNGR